MWLKQVKGGKYLVNTHARFQEEVWSIFHYLESMNLSDSYLPAPISPVFYYLGNGSNAVVLLED